MLVPAILAGGTGTRLWPLSREAHPKQFIPLVEEKSLFQLSLERLHHFKEVSKPLVVGNEQHRFLIAEQLRQSYFEQAPIILEPCLRNTAPAVALAAIYVLAHYHPDALLLVMPADHVLDGERFAEVVAQAIPHAQSGKLVTFGVLPTHPETGYGYIKKGAELTNGQGYTIANFIEKPPFKLAKQYVQSQEYLWNSGLFLFSAAAFMQELLLHEPAVYHAAKNAMHHAHYDKDFIRPSSVDFEKSPAISIDYAVMENTTHGVVMPLASAWNDVGAWDALMKLFPQDATGNAIKGDVLLQDCQDCFIQANHRLVVASGVKDLVIVETGDTLLVLNKEKAQAVKVLVEKMREEARKEVIHHRRVSRPWGFFDAIDGGDRFQVKRIMVAVGAKLSLQRHHHRSEHWVVVKGTARVTRGEETFLLAENQSTYIPIGVNHRLENVGKIPLEIIEVQSGAYLGEDDIVRLDDQYGRLGEKIAEKANACEN